MYARGFVWKIRHLDEVDTKKIKLPRAIKVSRGARPTDAVERATGRAPSSLQAVLSREFATGGGRRATPAAEPAA